MEFRAAFGARNGAIVASSRFLAELMAATPAASARIEAKVF